MCRSSNLGKELHHVKGSEGHTSSETANSSLEEDAEDPKGVSDVAVRQCWCGGQSFEVKDGSLCSAKVLHRHSAIDDMTAQNATCNSVASMPILNGFRKHCHTSAVQAEKDAKVAESCFSSLMCA